MLKLILRNRCILCSSITSNMQIFLENVRYYKFLRTDLEEVRNDVTRIRKSFGSISKKKKKRNITDNVEVIKAILKKYNIDTTPLKKNSIIFYEEPWVVEQRIMLLQEFGPMTITLMDVQEFIRKMYTPVGFWKSRHAIKPEVSLAKTIFSWIGDNSIFTTSSLTTLNESLPMRRYYQQCFIEYLKRELDLNNDQVKFILGNRCVLYNSFRLLSRLIKLLKNIQFSTDLIIENCWLLKQHPDNLENIINLVKNNLHENYNSVLLKNPKILYRNPKDLDFIFTYCKQYKIPPEDISRNYHVLVIHPCEFKRRIEALQQIPCTLVFLRHPRFLLLVKCYYRVLARVNYLKSKNLKYATINSLTGSRNYLEQLITQKKIYKMNLISFCRTIFEDDGDLIQQRIEVHPYCLYVPLQQMYETYIYLKEIFPMEIIYNHAYALVYNKTDLEAARKNLLKDPMYCNLPPGQLLALCIYKIEEKTHFSGEGVLTPEKFAEVANEDSYQDEKSKEDSKEH